VSGDSHAPGHDDQGHDDRGRDDLVRADAGGWISGPCLDPAQLAGPGSGGPRFGLNVGAWMREYGARYVLQGGRDGFGFACWRRDGAGRPAGQPVTAATLDDLAGLIEHGERTDARPDGG
jgi:hypothetical protein